MMELPVRAGKRLQDFSVAWQENRDRRDLRQQHADIRRERMTCSDSLRSFPQNQDWTRSMEMSPSGRFQVVEEKNQRQALITRDTVRWDAAIAAIILLAVLFTGILVADLAGIGLSSRNIGRLDDKVKLMTQKNEELESRLLSRTGDVTVCTEAVKLNLIASGGARTIGLTAPTNANMTLTGGMRQAAASSPDAAQGD